MNYVIARPNQRTLERFMEMFRSCPFNVNFDEIHLRLYAGEATPSKVSEVTGLVGVFGPAEIWFNDNGEEGHAEYSAPAQSEGILKRYKDLGGSNPEQCRLVFLPRAPALGRAAKPFLASFADSVVIEAKTLPFGFDADKLISV
jgi:hypothetical protein